MATKSKASKARARGRPAFSATSERRRHVSLCAGSGMRHEDIAMTLGISTVTLRKYFETELSAGAAKKRAEVVKALHAAALKGNTSAAKAYLAVEPQLAVPPAPLPEATAAPKIAAPLGKKDQAQAEAITADVGTEWADLLRPAAPLQ